MKINEFINESTTAGAIATVAAPMTTQKRSGVGKGVYGNEKVGNLLTGKKTSKPYANSVNESAKLSIKYVKYSGDDGGYYTVNQGNTSNGEFNTRAEAQKHLDKLKSKAKVNESKMKQVASDLETMQDGNFKQKYKKTKEQIMAVLGTPSSLKPKSKNEVNEAQLDEEDLIIVPGQGHKLKSGFIPHDQDRRDHEVEMARGDLFQAYQNAEKIHKLIKNVTEDEGLEGWVQAKITKAADYLNSVRQYLEGKYVQEMTGGVVAGGGVGEAADPVAKRITAKKWGGDDMYSWAVLVDGRPAVTGLSKSQVPYYKNMIMKKLREKPHLTGANIEEAAKKGLWTNIHAKRERIKHGSGEHMRKPGSKGAPSAQDFKDAAKEDIGEGIKEKIKGVIRREKAKAMPLVQTRRDYAMGKAGQAYEKGEPRKGAQYSAWAERDRKKMGHPTDNPAGTYRTKTSDYTNEAQTMKGALKNTLAKAEPGSKLDNSIKKHNANIKAGQAGTLKNAPEGYHFDKKGYCRLGDK